MSMADGDAAGSDVVYVVCMSMSCGLVHQLDQIRQRANENIREKPGRVGGRSDVCVCMWHGQWLTARADNFGAGWSRSSGQLIVDRLSCT